MKTRYFLMLMLFALGSCSLEVEVYDRLSSDNVLNTEDDARAAVTGIYHELRGGGWEEYNVSAFHR